jgi:CO/xanthine dehydrogenase Mo-binding subunit
MRAVGKVVYWLVVVLISLALVVALILFLESRDQSSVEAGARPGAHLSYELGATASKLVPTFGAAW